MKGSLIIAITLSKSLNTITSKFNIYYYYKNLNFNSNFLLFFIFNPKKA